MAGQRRLHRGRRPDVLRRCWSRPCSIPKQSVELDMTTQNIMSVNVPVYHFPDRQPGDDALTSIPTASPTTSGELDDGGGRRWPGVSAIC